MSEAAHTNASRDAWRVPVAVALTALLLAAPAIWNGFPLLYWDSYDYMGIPFGAKMPVFRTASYSMITASALLVPTIWTPIAVQCLVIAWILREAVEALVPGPVRRTLPIAAVATTLLTAFPWFTSQLMADCFTAPLILGVVGAAFGEPPPSRTRRIVLILALALAVAVHSSHIALLTGILIVLGALRLAAIVDPARLRFLKPRLLTPVLALVFGVTAATGANWVVTDKVFVSQSTDILMLARLVQDGIAKKYLREVCPKGAALMLCPHIDELPDNANQFLWTPGPFYNLGGWSREMREEARSIVLGSLATHPMDHLASAWNLTIEQLFQVRTGDGVVRLDTIHADDDPTRNPFMPKIIAKYYRPDLDEYWASRQRRNFGFEEINAVQVPLALAGYVAILIALIVGLRRRKRLIAGPALLVTLAILGNAFICGALSNPNNRYQARLAWVGGMIALTSVFRARERDEVRCLGENMPL